MEPEAVKALIEAGIPGAEATVTTDGNKYTAVVVAAAFEGKTLVAEQKMVYAVLDEHIKSGAIHALTIRACTPQEWEEQNTGR